MKRIFISLLYVFFPIMIFAAPFGLKMGMSIEEIAEQCEEEPAFVNDGVYLIRPVKSHPVFDYYAVYINEKTGLYQIRAISAPIASNKFGTELKNSFNNVKERIAKTYGKPKVNDRYKNTADTYYQKDEYWFYSLREGSRELSAVWGYNSSLADNLDTVALECSVTSGFYEGTGQLILYYYFNKSAPHNFKISGLFFTVFGQKHI